MNDDARNPVKAMQATYGLLSKVMVAEPQPTPETLPRPPLSPPKVGRFGEIPAAAAFT